MTLRRNHMRTPAIVVALGLATLPLAGCDDDARRICENRYTDIRADDWRCDSNDPTFIWVYYQHAPKRYPAVGQKVARKDVTTTTPKGFKAGSGSAPKQGGKPAGSGFKGAGSRAGSGGARHAPARGK